MTDLRAIPSHSFTGTLKHIATKGYPSALADVFAAMFPRFSDPSDFDWSRVPDIEAVRRNDKVVLTPPVTPRRFGGLQLPRSRYFAVCSDEFGDDGGTLARELDAYKDFARTGPIGLVDMGLQAGRVILGTQFERSREIRTVMLEPERLGLLLTKQSHDSFVAEDGRRLASLLFPYTVSTVTIESVLDLREPQVRAWCVENFSKPNEFWMWPESVPELKLEPPEQYESTVHSVPGRAPIPNRFVEMLPTLLNPELGAGGRGGITLQAIA